MLSITRVAGALRPRQIPDGAGETANPPHQGKILNMKRDKLISIKTQKKFIPNSIQIRDKDIRGPRLYQRTFHLDPSDMTIHW